MNYAQAQADQSVRQVVQQNGFLSSLLDEINTVSIALDSVYWAVRDTRMKVFGPWPEAVVDAATADAPQLSPPMEAQLIQAVSMLRAKVESVEENAKVLLHRI